jgi:hypothetical protein
VSRGRHAAVLLTAVLLTAVQRDVAVRPGTASAGGPLADVTGQASVAPVSGAFDQVGATAVPGSVTVDALRAELDAQSTSSGRSSQRFQPVCRTSQAISPYPA